MITNHVITTMRNSPKRVRQISETELRAELCSGVPIQLSTVSLDAEKTSQSNFLEQVQLERHGYAPLWDSIKSSNYSLPRADGKRVTMAGDLFGWVIGNGMTIQSLENLDIPCGIVQVRRVMGVLDYSHRLPTWNDDAKHAFRDVVVLGPTIIEMRYGDLMQGMLNNRPHPDGRRMNGIQGSALKFRKERSNIAA